jgi:YD repeat-containing protein
MYRRVLMAMCALLFVQCALPARASAQSCFGAFVWFFPDPIPKGATCFAGEGPFSMVCYMANGKCPPPSWCPTCQKNQQGAGAPINLSNGNTYIQQQDVKIPGLGGGLSLQRTWNSIWPSTVSAFQYGMFGQNWRSTYEEHVFLSGTYMVYMRSDGGYWYFGSSMGSNWTLSAPANIVATLSQGPTNWTLTFQSGEQRLFSVSSGSLVAIVDRNGNATQLTYDGVNRLVTVTDPASRTLTFTYLSDSSRVVTGVSSSVGLSLSYSYDSNNRLKQVTKPDSSTVSLTYNSQSLISAVTDSQGKILESHTYDGQGRGLTSSRANGVDAVTIAYP